MGLDISLISIIEAPVNQYMWLSLEDSPELGKLYPEFKVSRTYDDGDQKDGFWYKEHASQRKGVIKAFYSRYDTDVFIFNTTELIELFKYFHPDYAASFRKDFMDKFREGHHLIMMGY